MATYRNDHEAALARVAALELELDKARKSKATPVATSPRPRRKPWPVFAASVAGLVVGMASGVALAVVGAPDSARVDRDKLSSCANEIEAPAGFGADETDPHQVAPISIKPIARTAAPCRDELHAMIELAQLSRDERDALWKWAVQEDELAGAIARIEVYYASDPYELDSYSTAKQLWIEYDRAHTSRNRALDAWRRRFTSS